jgi:hypothetical protein
LDNVSEGVLRVLWSNLHTHFKEIETIEMTSKIIH